MNWVVVVSWILPKIGDRKDLAGDGEHVVEGE